MKKNNTQKKKNTNNKFAQETNNWTGKKNSQKVAKVQMPCVTKKFDENRKMNIGLFVDSFFPMIDGVVNVVDNYAKRLCKFANVTVFTTAPRDKNFVDNFDYKVVRCSKFEVPGLDYDLGMPSFDSKFQKELKDSNLDIVHIHSPFSIGKAGLAYAKKHKLPVVATNHSQFKQDFFKATNSPAITDVLLANVMKVFNACDENWAVNSQVAKVYDEYGLKKPAKVMHNATDMKFFDDKAQIDKLRKKYAIANDEKVLLFVGRICELKNIYFSLDALIELKKMGFKFKMFFVGSGQDEVAFAKAIEKNNMQDFVTMVGRISDRTELAKFYRMADLLLFPSMYDCASLVQIEAASQKTPTLFLQNSVTSAGIADNQNGYFAEQDPKKYAERIVQIFGDKKTYESVCENCHKTVFLSWDDEIQQVYQNYQKLIRQNQIKLIAKKRINSYKLTRKMVAQQTKFAKKKIAKQTKAKKEKKN